MVGAPVSTDEYVLGREMELAKNEGVDRLARCLVNIPDKQAAAALIAIESLGWRTNCLRRALFTLLSLEACRRADNRGTVGVN